MIKTIFIAILAYSFLTVPSAAKEIGFDPGLNTALAASLYPGGKHYKEYCPDSPTGRCYGTIPNAGGFYTIPIEADTEENIERNKDVFINDGFHWKRDQNRKVDC